MHQPQLKVSSKFLSFWLTFFSRIEIELGDVLFSFELALVCRDGLAANFGLVFTTEKTFDASFLAFVFKIFNIFGAIFTDLAKTSKILFKISQRFFKN